MSNLQIQRALEKQRNELYHSLRGQTLSGLFKQEYKSIKEGTTVYLGEIDEDVLDELKNLSKGTSNDKAFQDAVENINQLGNEAIINSFQADIIQLLNFIRDNGYENKLQAIFIEYDYYYHFKGIVSGYGKQEYPIITEPRYVSDEIDFSKVEFAGIEAINFEKAWVDCEAFEWTTEHLDIYYKLLNLYQLNSRVLLHQAIQQCFSDEQLDFLKVRPFTFYINEHDCEVMTLFRID